MTEPSSLAALLKWFRTEWQAEMGSGRIHVRDTDAGGDPDWHARFRALVELPKVKDGDPVEWTGSSSTSLPLRYHLRNMARASHRGRTRAEFLFRLACLDFDVMVAARHTSPAAWDHHGEQWALDFAENSLRRLHRRCIDPRWNDAEGPRTFVQRRIGKSEAQSAAEDAA